MEGKIRDPHQKALALNLDESSYGTIAEIGAGQEVARWFFKVGGAAGTIAKAMSAYSMKFSDAIYGPCQRYVSRERLRDMLDMEYRLVVERLDESIGAKSTFFSFANTVAARSFTYKTDGHGWLGVLFQRTPGEDPSRIDIHISLHGKQHLQDQETIGILGVNLIYGAMRLHDQPEELLKSLLDQLYPELLEVDMIEFSGPAFVNVDNRLMALRLVQYGLSNATMFTSDGSVAQIADALYKKAVLLERSRFRPPTKLTVDLINCAHKAFMFDTDVAEEDILELSEMTLTNLTEDNDDVDVHDFLNRADILCALGKSVLISNYGEHFRLAQYLFRYTNKPIALAMGLPTLRALFNEKYYEKLPGGILESFGRLFKNDLRLYVCPELDAVSQSKVGVEELTVEPHLRYLFSHLKENKYIRTLDTVKEEYLSIYSHEVLHNIKKGCHEWEDMVPDEVSSMIREKKLFDWKEG